MSLHLNRLYDLHTFRDERKGGPQSGSRTVATPLARLARIPPGPGAATVLLIKPCNASRKGRLDHHQGSQEIARKSPQVLTRLAPGSRPIRISWYRIPSSFCANAVSKLNPDTQRSHILHNQNLVDPDFARACLLRPSGRSRAPRLGGRIKSDYKRPIAYAMIRLYRAAVHAGGSWCHVDAGSSHLQEPFQPQVLGRPS